MHKVLDRLGQVHAECVRTDAGAKARKLQVSSADTSSFHWGYTDYILPRRRNVDPMNIALARDVFLMPDSHIEYEYVLGFEDEDDVGRGEIIVAYRLEHGFEFDPDTNPTSYDFPVTLFWEAVSRSWKATARLRHGEGKETRYTRPPEWTEILAAHKLDGFGELARGLSRKRAHTCIDAMMDIIVKHGPTMAQQKKRGPRG